MTSDRKFLGKIDCQNKITQTEAYAMMILDEDDIEKIPYAKYQTWKVWNPKRPDRGCLYFDTHNEGRAIMLAYMDGRLCPVVNGEIASEVLEAEPSERPPRKKVIDRWNKIPRNNKIFGAKRKKRFY